MGRSMSFGRLGRRARRLAGLAGLGVVGLVAACSSPAEKAGSAPEPERVGTVSEALVTNLPCTASHALASSAVFGATISGGTGMFTGGVSGCTVTTSTSGGATCTVGAGGVVTYTAGATAGYNILSSRSGDYLLLSGTAVQTGGTVGTSAQLWRMAAASAGFTFQSAGLASPVGTLKYMRSTGTAIVADQPAATAGVFTADDCNNGAPYNRFGFAVGATNKVWQAQAPVIGVAGALCSQASGSPWEGFSLVSGADVLTVKDSAGNSGTCTVTVEPPVSVFPSTIALASSTAIPAQASDVNALQAWGGSGVFNGGLPAGCAVTTNASMSAGGCTVTGSGQIQYTAGAGSGTDVLTVTDNQGHFGTVNVVVAGTVVSIGFTVNPIQALPPKTAAVLTVTGGSGLTWTLVTNNSGATLNTSTGAYTAGATGDVSDLVSVTDGTNTGTIVIEVGAPITISPSQPMSKAAGTIAFSASGGNGSGYTWSLMTNASGGSIGATTGAYTAGATPGTDVVKVVDALGNQATVSVPVLCGADSSLQILYPYNKTVFPLAMAPPLVQWKDNGTAAYAKVTLLYPTSGTSIFKWSEIVPENGALSTPYNLLPTALPVSGGGRAQIPPLVWTTFQNAASGSDALISVQTLESNQGTYPATIQIHFANAQLKGTIYYQTYDTNLVAHGPGTPTGAILGIQVGSPTPTLVDGSAATCRACHSVSANGTLMMVNDSGGATDDNLYGGNHNVALPAATESTMGTLGTAPNDGRWSWPAVSPDATMMFTSEGNQPTWMSGQWGQTPSNVAQFASGLYSATTGAAIATTGLPTGLQAKFPAWATDTSAIAFNYAAGATGAVSPGDDQSLAMMSYVPASKTFSALTVLFNPPNPPASYPSNSGAAEWPSFMPAGNSGIVFQNRVAYDCQEPGADGASGGSNLGNGAGELQGSIGALGDLWWVNTTGTAVPHHLANANGTGYLPLGKNAHGLAGSTLTTPNITSFNCGTTPCPFDSSGQIPTSAQMTSSGGCNGACGGCQTALLTAMGNGNDALLNFKPTVNPQVTGGYQWVAFMSRRMYGNVATLNPWASNPRTTAEIRNNASPQYPETKKLWVAAMSMSPSAGTDPSYPAFYLDGQELYAGNSRSYWVLPQCIVPSATRSTATVCTSNQDCCVMGTGTPASCTLDIPIATTPPTKHCVPNTAITCSADGAACNVDGDCCNLVSEGTRCSGGVCQIPPQPGYPPAETLSYDYQGTCAGGTVVGDASMGTAAVWQFIQSDQTIPAGTSITITLQTATTQAGLSAAVASTSYSISSTVVSPMYLSSPQVLMGMTTMAQTVDNFLRSLTPAQASKTWLRVNVTLNASPDKMSAPTLISLEPTFDCMANE